MKDLLNNSEQKVLLEANIWADDHNGDSVDLRGEGRKVLVIANVGSTSTATIQITIQESSDDSSWSTLQALTVGNLTTGLETVDLTPTKRYIRAICTIATKESARTDVGMAVGVVIYNLRHIPSNI